MPKLVLLLILLTIQTSLDVLGWLFGGLNSQGRSKGIFLELFAARWYLWINQNSCRQNLTLPL